MFSIIPKANFTFSVTFILLSAIAFILDMFNPLPDDKILSRPILKQSADDNSKFGEDSRKFSKWVENTVDKGEIPTVFSKGLFPKDVKRCHCVGMG